MINSIKPLQAINLQLGVVKILYRSRIPRNWDGADGATALEKEIGWLIGIFWIARRQTNKTDRSGYKQKSKKGYVQADNL